MDERSVPESRRLKSSRFRSARFRLFKIHHISRPYAYHLILIMLLYLLFIPTDIVNVSESLVVVLSMRIVTFLLTVTAVVYFRNVMPKYFDAAEALILLSVYFTVLYIGYLALQQGSFGYQNGTLVVMLGVGTVLRLNFRVSWLLMTAMLVGYFCVIFPIKFANSPASEQDFAMIFVAAYVICLVACHRREKEELQLFERSQQVRKQQLALQAQHRKLALMSRTDPLTGLKNRHSLNEVETQNTQLDDQRRDDSCGVLMIDIDYFKAINDNYGHLVGDEVIRGVAAVIKQVCQRQSDLCFRYGGEEFLVILPATTQQGLQNLAEQICAEVLEQHFADGSLRVSVSIGLMVNTDNLLDLEDSIAHADQALYQAKQAGRNRWMSWGK